MVRSAAAIVFCAVIALKVTAVEQPAVETHTIWDCDSTAGIAGIERETQLHKQGTAAIRWRNHSRVPQLHVPGVPSDWNAYNQLRFWLHNAKPLATRLMVIVQSENPTTKGPDYWGHGIGLGFTGWKEIILPVGVQSGTRSPRGWGQIDGILITASGWGNTPHADADVVIDDVRLQFDPPRPGPRMTDTAFFESLDLAQPALDAVKKAVEASNLPAAKQAMLEHMRHRRSPRWWFAAQHRPTEHVPVSGGSSGWDYYSTSFKVDWTGWREFTLPLDQWRHARKPIGWQWISRLSFSATYGDRKPNADTCLVFDSVQLSGDHPVSLGEFENEDDFQRWQNLQPTSTPVKTGSRAGQWTRLPDRPAAGIADMPHDWRNFTALRFWVHSSKATGDIITIIADSDTPGIVKKADIILQHTYRGYSLGKDIDWQSNKYALSDPAYTREWTYDLNRFGHWRTLGQAYWATGDEQYAREWIAEMRDWIEDNPWPLFETGNRTLTWRTIEAGIRTSGSWPDSLYYFLESPSLTGDDLVTFLKSWIEHAHHLMRITTEHPEHRGNWVTMECNGLGHLGILLPECKDSSRWLKTAVDRLSLELDRQVYPDGAQKELTTGYHQVARRNFVDLLKLARYNQIAVPDDYAARLERMYNYNLKAMTPEGHLPPLNDAGYTNVLPSLAEGEELFGRQDFLWAASGGTSGTPVNYTSIAFPFAGQYVMRSGWQLDDRYLLFESGPYGIGHQHEDKLSLFIYGYGRVLLTEAGTYSYDHSKYRRYVLGSWAHNTILVDGQQQHRRGLTATYETSKPLDNLWIHGDVFDAANGRYNSGYGPKRDRTVSHERTVVFIRPDYWIVVDRLRAKGPHQYDILWHLNADAAEQTAESMTAWGTDRAQANLMVVPALTEGLSLDIVIGRKDPVLGFAPAKKRKPIPVLDYHKKATGPVTLTWVLVPYPGKRPTVTTTAEKRDGGTVVQVTHQGGKDLVYVADHGEKQTIRLGNRTLTGRIAVVRTDARSTVVSSDAQ